MSNFSIAMRRNHLTPEDQAIFGRFSALQQMAIGVDESSDIRWMHEIAEWATGYKCTGGIMKESALRAWLAFHCNASYEDTIK